GCGLKKHPISEPRMIPRPLLRPLGRGRLADAACVSTTLPEGAMKAVIRKTASVQHHPAPRRNERRLVTPHPRPRILSLAAGAAALPVLSRGAKAQAYPTRPITMIVPFAPGGATDTSARIMAEGMKISLGQPIIIENVSGAEGTVGVGRTARSAPDG